MAAEAAREVSGRSSHAESAAGPGSNFINFCREQNLGPRQGAPVKGGERWAAEAALEQRMGRKLGQESWATRGWVMGCLRSRRGRRRRLAPVRRWESSGSAR